MKTFITGALALFAGLFIGGLNQPPAATAVGPVVNSVDHQADVQLATYWLWYRAARETDRTGNEFRQFVQEVINPLVVAAVNCGANPSHPDYQADADCDGEG